MKTIVLSLLLCFMFTSCKKENQKTCWQLVSLGGGIMQGSVVCDKTQREMEKQFTGTYHFYRTSEPVYCWRITGSSSGYLQNYPQSMLDRFYPASSNQRTKVGCNSFCIWELTLNARSKTTGQYQPPRNRVEVYDNADTCSKLYVGREIITNETIDSIFTVTYKTKF